MAVGFERAALEATKWRHEAGLEYLDRPKILA
jgi:hypothetical protein